MIMINVRYFGIEQYSQNGPELDVIGDTVFTQTDPNGDSPSPFVSTVFNNSVQCRVQTCFLQHDSFDLGQGLVLKIWL